LELKKIILKKKTIQYKFQASSTLIDMETSWTTFKKNINFSEYEENMKERKKPRNSR